MEKGGYTEPHPGTTTGKTSRGGSTKSSRKCPDKAVNELKKTVDGMNELRRGLLAEKPNYMKGTHSNIMQRGRRKKG